MIMISGGYQSMSNLLLFNPTMGTDLVDDLSQEMLGLFGFPPA